MAITQINSVTVNKLSLAQYQELKANNQLNNNEVYSITDLDEYIDSINHLRLNRIIKSGSDITFLNSNFHDFSDVPIDTSLATISALNGRNYTYYLRYISGTYKIRLESSTGFNIDIYSGAAKNNMNLVYSSDYVIYTTAGYGDYSKVTYINESYLDVIDSIILINKSH